MFENITAQEFELGVFPNIGAWRLVTSIDDFHTLFLSPERFLQDDDAVDDDSTR